MSPTGEEENGAGALDGFDEAEGVGPEDVVVFQDESGQRYECVLLAVVEHEGQDYAVLARAEQLASENEEEAMELFLFRYDVDEGGEEQFSPIEDDATYEAVRSFCATLMEEGELEV